DCTRAIGSDFSKVTLQRLSLIIITNPNDAWARIIVEELRRKSAVTTTTSSTNFTNSSNSTPFFKYQKELKEDDLALFEERYSKLNGKWTLKSGRSVEDVIYQEAKTFKLEHPYHSFIISMDDESLKNLFTEEEIEEMIAASGKNDLEAALPAHLEDLLKNLARKSTFVGIENCFNSYRHSRITHPEEQWIVQRILDYIDLFFDGDSARKFNISRTINEFAAGSAASNESNDINRDISSLKKVSRQIPGDVPDLSFKYNDNELRCVEFGLYDNDANSTKEVNERRIKTLKIMRNSCWKIVNEYEMNLASINMVSFVMSGPHLTSSIISFHSGIALVYSSGRMKMPTNIKETSRLFPRALRLCYNAGMIMKKTVEVLDEVCQSEESSAGVKELFFPSAFELNGVNTSNKRRKTS
ncbi:hypothetical protein CU098_003701, partial [Rhizopus stolonifer]